MQSFSKDDIVIKKERDESDSRRWIVIRKDSADKRNHWLCNDVRLKMEEEVEK